MSHASIVSATAKRSPTASSATTTQADPKHTANSTQNSSAYANERKYPDINTQSQQYLSLSPMSSSVVTPTEDIAAEKRRKAAAAARRRRRKINLSRRQHNSPRSVSQSRVFSGPSLTELSPDIVAQRKVAQRKQDEREDENKNFASDDPAPYHRPSTSAGTFASATKAVPSQPLVAARRIRSTVDGMAEVANRWKAQEIVALPTECTYEACISLQTSCSDMLDASEQKIQATSPPDWAFRIDRLRQAATANGTTTTSLTGAPYCWVPRTADCPLLRDCFPVRVYAMRDSGGKAQAAHRFNETLEVVQRLARHVWPGPVTMRVAVPPTEGTNNVSTSQKRDFWSALTSSHTLNGPQQSTSSTSSSPSCPYLTLRCPQHPLAVKASQKHLDMEGRRSNSSAQSPNKSQGTEDKSNKNNFSVLVGLPVAHHDTQYCRSSVDVQGTFAKASSAALSAVLDGENVEELFAVPTCEYGSPWHTQVWVHGPDRTITVVKTIPPQEAPAVVASSNPLLCGTTVKTDLCETRIKAALRQRVPTRPQLSKTKERIVQAVMCRWKISEVDLV